MNIQERCEQWHLRIEDLISDRVVVNFDRDLADAQKLHTEIRDYNNMIVTQGLNKLYGKRYKATRSAFFPEMRTFLADLRIDKKKAEVSLVSEYDAMAQQLASIMQKRRDEAYRN
jgi:hypothetical protein